MDVNNVTPIQLKMMALVEPAYPFWIMKFFKACLKIVSFFSDLLFGYSLFDGLKSERELAKNYQQSAHVGNLKNNLAVILG